MYAARIRPPGAGRWLDLTGPGGVPAGWVVIVGPNGAGKSELLAGIAAGSGEVELAGGGGPALLYRDDRRLTGIDRLAALADDIGRRLGADAAGLVLIDEVEAHLHLSAQQEVGFLLTARFPAVQFIVSTHSPYVCQAADVIIRLDPAYLADDDLWARAAYGSGDDAALSDLFGLESPYSAPARELREELVRLEIAVLDGTADGIQRERFRDLQALLTSSPSARAEEVKARLRQRAAARGGRRGGTG